MSLLICLGCTLYEWTYARYDSWHRYGYYHWVLMEEYYPDDAELYYALWIVIISCAFVMYILALVISHFGYKRVQTVGINDAAESSNQQAKTKIELQLSQSVN